MDNSIVMTERNRAMPMIDIHLPHDVLDDAQAKDLADTLGGTLLKWEGAPDTEFFRSITWVYVHRGAPAVGDRFRVEVTVPEGALNQRKKTGLIGDVHAVVKEAVGLGDDEALNIWTLIRDVPEGSWGAAGTPVEFAQLLQLSAAEKEAAG